MSERTAAAERRGYPERVLSRAGILILLRPVLHPTYTHLAESLRELESRLHVDEMWRELFHDEPPRERWLFDLNCRLVWRVHEELFPLNLQALDDLYNSGEEDVLWGPVYYDGHKVVWEVEAITYLEDWAQPVVAVIADCLVPEYSREETWNGIDAWWDDKGYTRPSYSYLGRDPDLAELRRALQAQPPPLDGLTAALDVVDGNTGNIFLDHPPLLWLEEYGCFDDIWNYCWCANCLLELAEVYDRARPTLRRLDAYQAWYDATPDAERTVIELLVRLIDEPWHIEEERVAFDG